MTLLLGADSELPQTSLIAGHEIWGVYIAGSIGHVYTAGELQDLGRSGVKGVLPIVVPLQSKPEDGPWWWATDEGAAEIVRLVADARAWGLHGGAPLCFDIEEATAEAMIAVDPGLPAKVEARIAAATTAYGYEPWTYGGAVWHNAIPQPKAKRWLAKWEAESGEAGETPAALPAGYDGWQFAGNVSDGRIDLDVFAGGLKFLGPDGIPGVIGEPEQAPKEDGTPATGGEAPASPGTDTGSPSPSSAEPSPSSESSTEPTPPSSTSSDEAEAAKDAAVAESEVEHADPGATADAVELDKTADAPATPTHEAEIHDLTSKIRAELQVHDEEHSIAMANIATHLAELDDLANAEAAVKESPK